MKYDDVMEQLAQSYLDILSNNDLHELQKDNSLSGFFLAAPSKAYFTSPIKLIIVGQETRGWRNLNCPIKTTKDWDIESILNSMSASTSFNDSKPGKSRFRQKYADASKRICINSSAPDRAAVWSNQFCLDHKKTKPIGTKNFNLIKSISYQLLQAQFETLKPDIALFFTGSSRDRYLKECFPAYQTLEVITPRRLWKFKVSDTICYRTNHPRWPKSKRHIDNAIDLILSDTPS